MFEYICLFDRQQTPDMLDNFDNTTMLEPVPSEDFETLSSKYDALLSFYSVRTNNVLQTLMASYIKYTGDKNAQPRSIGGGTYAKILKQGVAFGLENPDLPSVCHISDEYIEIAELIKATLIYLDAIYELCK